MRRKSPAFSLIEIIVAGTLLSIVLAVTVQVFIPAMRAWSASQKRSELFQSLLVSSNRIADDILHSSPDSLQVDSDGVVLFRRATPRDLESSPEFLEAAGIWKEGDTLRRAGKKLTVGGINIFTATDLKVEKDQRTLARDLTRFEATVKQPWRLEFEMEVEKAGRKLELSSSYTSIFAPLDASVAAKDLKSSE